jgi:hypothetical protein
MSFIDTYIANHQIGTISASKQKYLNLLEQDLNVALENQKGLKFSQIINKHTNDIYDLINKIRKEFYAKKWKSWSGVLSTLQFVYSIALEVYQIIENIAGDIVPPGTPKAEQGKVKLAFAKELIYFIWKIIGPLDNSFNWVPFKKTIERKLVMWFAGMAIEAAHKFFKANPVGVKSAGVISVKSFAAGTIIKAI